MRCAKTTSSSAPSPSSDATRRVTKNVGMPRVVAIAILLLALAPVSGALAAKGSSKCESYSTSVSTDILGGDKTDYSVCAYGHMTTSDTPSPGQGCIHKPAFGCYECKRGSLAGDVRAHVCECITKAKRDEVYDDRMGTYNAGGWTLVVVGALGVLFALYCLFNEDAWERWALAAGDVDVGAGCKFLLAFMQFWLLPLLLLGGGFLILGLGWSADASYFNGCCSGYDKCVPDPHD